MSTSKHIDRICAIALLLSVALTVLSMDGKSPGLLSAPRAMGYEELFDASMVHTVDFVMDDWDGFLDACPGEEYRPCTAVIDGEPFKDVGIRAKGNSSLRSVEKLDSGRYSFKLEFDHYDTGKTYHGLDKLCLNNLIQDNSMMKDYLVYRMMEQFGVAAPMCSYAWITVNGNDWGIYLAVEGIEDGFLRRNYGAGAGVLYKPDCTSAGRPVNSDDVRLVWHGDDPDGYPDIFGNAKSDVTDAGRTRLVTALRRLGEGDLSVIDIDAVLRYFVVHNFVSNDDGYTGAMVHNYYLHEKDGVLSMVPWDYNLAFLACRDDGANDVVNDPIDSPLCVSGDGSRPMADWIFRDGYGTAMYHRYFAEFLATVDPCGIIGDALALIGPYVERDPTRFCTAESFRSSAESLETLCRLRAESVSGQLDGVIPSTWQARYGREGSLVDASWIDLSAMTAADACPVAAMVDGAGIGRVPGPEAAEEDLPGGYAQDRDPSAGDAIAGPVLLGGSVLGLSFGLAFVFRFRRYGKAWREGGLS